MKKVAVVRERFPGERRVALLPENVEKLSDAGYQVLVEQGAGEAAGIADQLYIEAGASVTDRNGLRGADVLVQVRSLGANAATGRDDLEILSSGQLVIGMCDPLGNAPAIAELAHSGVSQIALEMVPRITRAQSMDVLSSMATIAGYRAVLHAAYQLPRMFPLNMTAAGTLAAARVFIIGAGVAGLQAAATAKRLGAIVSAYDVRPDCREQVESVGAKFVELELETEDSEDAGGYAKEQTEDFLIHQRAFMAEVAAEHDIVITTAAIPGRQSPLLLTSEAVQAMAAGSVIVDLAAERGGNCAETEADQTIVVDGVTILGPTNLPAEIPYHASQMFGNNVTNLLLHLISDDGEIELDLSDDIISGCLVMKDGEIVNERIGSILGVAVDSAVPAETAATDAEPSEGESGAGDDITALDAGDEKEERLADDEQVEDVATDSTESSWSDDQELAADEEDASDEEDWSAVLSESGDDESPDEQELAIAESDDELVDEYDVEAEFTSDEELGEDEEYEDELADDGSDDSEEVEDDEEYEELEYEEVEYEEGTEQEADEPEELESELESELDEEDADAQEYELEEYEEEVAEEEADGQEDPEDLEDQEYELEDYDAEEDYTDDDEPDYDFSDYEDA